MRIWVSNLHKMYDTNEGNVERGTIRSGGTNENNELIKFSKISRWIARTMVADPALLPLLCGSESCDESTERNNIDLPRDEY